MIEKKDVILVKKLQGLNTISSICKKLGIEEKTAINYIYELRKKGFVKTTRGRNKIRIYSISPVKKKELGYPGLYDIINKHSPMKISKPFEHRVYEEMSIEEAVVKALETKDFRVILAGLFLFRHIKNWSRLYQYAKRSDVRRQVGALYDLSRKVTRVKRIDRRIEKNLLSAKQKNKFIIPGVKTKDFPETEKKWRVYIPFTKGDLDRLR